MEDSVKPPTRAWWWANAPRPSPRRAELRRVLTAVRAVRWCGQCFFNVDSFNPTVAILTILYSWAGLGIAIVNDFKSIEGDRELGLMSLPVQFGIDTAKWICVGSIDFTQLGVAG